MITDHGVKRLSHLMKLREINICGCAKLTDGCLAYLTALPALKILSFISIKGGSRKRRTAGQRLAGHRADGQLVNGFSQIS